MKIVVIGGAGQLARSLVQSASRDPELSLRTLARPEVDLAEPASIAALGAIEADVVINAAAYTAVDRAEDEPGAAFRINAEAPAELAAAARRGGARFFQISTDYVFDGEAGCAYVEDAPTNPLSVYGRSKLAGEQAVRGADPTATIVRTSWVFSPFGHNFLRTMMRLGAERAEVNVVGDQSGNPTSAPDLADALLAMARRQDEGTPIRRGRTYHLTGSGTTSWAGFAAGIFAACETQGLPTARVNPIASSAWPTRARRPRNSALDCSAFTRDFGFSLPAWEASVASILTEMG